jgi:hypothetical protein
LVVASLMLCCSGRLGLGRMNGLVLSSCSHKQRACVEALNTTHRSKTIRLAYCKTSSTAFVSRRRDTFNTMQSSKVARFQNTCHPFIKIKCKKTDIKVMNI